MKQLWLVGILAGAVLAAPVSAQPAEKAPARKAAQAEASGVVNLGSVHIAQKVTANGEALAPGTYALRVTTEEPKTAVGQTPNAERWVEFLKSGKIAGREVATIIADADIKQVAKGPRPAQGGSRVELLKGNEYVRVWVNKGGNNYLINLPAVAAKK